MKIDAIVLAGHGKASKKILGKNKSFMDMGGIPLFCYVLSALQKTPYIENIFIVGPKEELEIKIRKASRFLNANKKITIVQQKSNLLKSSWSTFLETLHNQPSNTAQTLFKNREKAVLYLAGDNPLITHHEISEFLSNCEIEKYDYFLGITPEDNLKHFYPSKEKRGIKMAYLPTREKLFRLNNLHLVKPLKLKKKEYIQDVYKYRYQRKIRNIARFSWEMICNGAVGKSLRIYFMIQLALFSSYMNWRYLNSVVRSRLPRNEIEKCISEILGTRFISVETHFGGAALDIDSKKDLEVIKLRFNEWRQFQEEIANNNFPFIKIKNSA